MRIDRDIVLNGGFDGILIDSGSGASGSVAKV